MPGLPVCIACGFDLTAPAPEPVSVMPTVSARNPLYEGRRRPPRATHWWFLIEHPQLQLIRLLLRASLWGLLPGLGALQRGDRQLAAWQGGALVSLAVLYLLLWTIPVQAYVPWALLSLMGHAMVLEQAARVEGHRQTAQRPGVLLAMAICLLVWSAQNLAFDTVFPTVRLGGSDALRGGAFLVREVPLDEVKVGQLAVRGGGNMLEFLDSVVAPVIALPGQTISCDDKGVVRVDGVASTVPALRGGRPGQLQERVVPPGHVSLLDQSVAPISYGVMHGVLYYRWLPRTARGPVDWPPVPPDSDGDAP